MVEGRVRNITDKLVRLSKKGFDWESWQKAFPEEFAEALKRSRDIKNKERL